MRDGGLILGGGGLYIAERCGVLEDLAVRHHWRFWARGPGYPYDILELGSYLVGRVELGFGQCLQSATVVKKASGQTEGY
jgi:hypothetical protein